MGAGNSGASAQLARPRMRLVVDLRQLRGGQLRVALRRREPLVAEQFLNRTQVSAFFQQMRAECMTQRMRMHVR